MKELNTTSAKKFKGNFRTRMKNVFLPIKIYRMNNAWIHKMFKSFSKMTFKETLSPEYIDMANELPSSKLFSDECHCHHVSELEGIYCKLPPREQQIFLLYVRGTSIIEISLQQNLRQKEIVHLLRNTLKIN